MTKEDLIAALGASEKDIQRLQDLLKKAKATNVGRTEIRELAKKISRKWFEDLQRNLSKFGVSEETIAKYNPLFDKLLVLSLKKSRRETYLKMTSGIVEDFQIELVAPVMKSTNPILGLEHLASILDTITDAAEKDYLSEAVNCATRGYSRASAVLGWNACVHRMHRKVEKLGFDEFNKKSDEMKNITEGRFKRFNKSFRVHSINELRTTVFDTDLLWVIEYWGLIDGNQHERLQTCFTMRSNCAHPGEAQISPENLASFYSDLKNMILDNPKFRM